MAKATDDLQMPLALNANECKNCGVVDSGNYRPNHTLIVTTIVIAVEFIANKAVDECSSVCCVKLSSVLAVLHPYVSRTIAPRMVVFESVYDAKRPANSLTTFVICRLLV